MGHLNGIITGPVNDSDLAVVLGVRRRRWKSFCTCPWINPWAMFKPVPLAKIEDLTLADRQSVNFGIALGYMASAKSEAVLMTEELQPDLPEAPAWAYAPPVRGQHTFRINDFVNNENPSAPGYNSHAKPPMSGFSDITLFQSEFGSESKVYSFNFKWGPASNQGANDTSGIEIPITMLCSNITDGNWRLGLLIYFPVGNGFVVGIASSPEPISDTAQPGQMMIRPGATGRLSQLFNKVYSEGLKELDAIPILAYRLNRASGASGSQDRFMFDADSKIISMPLGERIKIKLASRFADVHVTFNSITIKYLDKPGNSKATYTLSPTNAASGQHITQLAPPSATNSVRCSIVLDFNMTGLMASGDSVPKSLIKVGISNIFINSPEITLERYLDSEWTGLGAIVTLGGRYRLTATDILNPNSDDRSALMNLIENLPRRATYSVDNAIRPYISLDSNIFASGNYFYHHG